MNDTLYSLMFKAFEPYLYIIIACLVIVIAGLVIITFNIDKTNRLLARMVDFLDRNQEM